RRVDPQDENERQKLPAKMPYVVIVIDEVGDLLMSMKKEVESHIIRLAQKSRAAGIHLILATQRPTVDVVTGLIKSNLPARICFQVASRSDSGVVLDEKGAEKLLGRGDMLFLQPGTSTLVRGQGAYVDDQEIERVTAAIELDTPNYDTELLNVKAKTDALDGDGDLGEKLRSRDEMYEQAIEIVIREQRGSTSLLQRALGIGYGRASRLIDFMAEDGLVGGYNGSNARDVLLTPEEWEAKKAGVG
ncbi:MAG: DNA translocase FtsK, partial [Planctomycetia bacterium]|nr:DNA translocase FtsK [Planctomycetia bacterium]